jgi:Phage tail tube protein
MASIVNATDVVVKVNSVIVGCAQSAEFTVSREMDEATCSASGGWKQVSPGQKSWSGSFSAVLRNFTTAEEAANVSFDEILDLLDDGTEVTVEYSRIAGGKRYSGQAYLSEVSYSQPDKGAVTWSANYEGNGAFVTIAGV